ncbi:MAG: hypothetical protein IT388_04495 [Nitrospirales bacterium]|nr:hypothetical protein [Nitrospirales bacterium]
MEVLYRYGRGPSLRIMPVAAITEGEGRYGIQEEKEQTERADSKPYFRVVQHVLIVSEPLPSVQLRRAGRRPLFRQLRGEEGKCSIKEMPSPECTCDILSISVEAIIRYSDRIRREEFWQKADPDHIRVKNGKKN